MGGVSCQHLGGGHQAPSGQVEVPPAVFRDQSLAAGASLLPVLVGM